MTGPLQVVHRWEDPHLLPAGMDVRDDMGRSFRTLGRDLFVTSLGARCKSADLEFPLTIEGTTP